MLFCGLLIFFKINFLSDLNRGPSCLQMLSADNIGKQIVATINCLCGKGHHFLLTCSTQASNECSDDPTHPRCLTRVFAAHLYKVWK